MHNNSTDFLINRRNKPSNSLAESEKYAINNNFTITSRSSFKDLLVAFAYSGLTSIFKPNTNFRAVNKHIVLSKNTITCAHNAMSSGASSSLPSQKYSIPDLVRMGVPCIDLDIIHDGVNLMVSHSLGNLEPLLPSPNVRFPLDAKQAFSDVLQQIRDVFDNSDAPTYPLIVTLENYVPAKDISSTIEKYFTPDEIFSSVDLKNKKDIWPSLEDMQNMGKKISFWVQNHEISGQDCKSLIKVNYGTALTSYDDSHVSVGRSSNFDFSNKKAELPSVDPLSVINDNIMNPLSAADIKNAQLQSVNIIKRDNIAK